MMWKGVPKNGLHPICTILRDSERNSSRRYTKWNFLGGSLWEAGSSLSLETCKPITDAVLWGCGRRIGSHLCDKTSDEVAAKLPCSLENQRPHEHPE